mmetsp:Transcript_5219/g.10963  ORF Transcript_5219/g.10963 Transcript_5219/m.10963 type:complete len:161 (+) Transcript_5219:1067-1549(+)
MVSCSRCLLSVRSNQSDVAAKQNSPSLKRKAALRSGLRHRTTPLHKTTYTSLGARIQPTTRISTHSTRRQSTHTRTQPLFFRVVETKHNRKGKKKAPCRTEDPPEPTRFASSWRSNTNARTHAPIHSHGHTRTITLYYHAFPYRPTESFPHTRPIYVSLL